MHISKRYDYESLNEQRKKLRCRKKSRTVQSDMDAADINKIMAKYEKTGVIVDPIMGERKPMYGDFTEVKDYHTMLCAVKRVDVAFSKLPASLRNMFENDPQKLIIYLEDPKNDKEAVKLGLKDYNVLLTALADDGVTKITQEEREALDLKKAAPAGAAVPPGTGSV